MREDMAQYRKNQDTIGRFVDDEFVVGEEFTSPKRVTYNAYKRWAEEVGEHYILTLSEFNEKMQGRFTDSRSGSVRFWKGFRRVSTADVLRQHRSCTGGPLNPDFLDVSASESQLGALSRCDEGPIEVIRGIVQGQFADFQNPFLEPEIVAVLYLLRPARIQKCHQFWENF